MLLLVLKSMIFPFIHQALAPNFKPLISAVFTLAPNATWVNKSEL